MQPSCTDGDPLTTQRTLKTKNCSLLTRMLRSEIVVPDPVRSRPSSGNDPQPTRPRGSPASVIGSDCPPVKGNGRHSRSSRRDASNPHVHVEKNSIWVDDDCKSEWSDTGSESSSIQREPEHEPSEYQKSYPEATAVVNVSPASIIAIAELGHHLDAMRYLVNLYDKSDAITHSGSTFPPPPSPYVARRAFADFGRLSRRRDQRAARIRVCPHSHALHYLL